MSSVDKEQPLDISIFSDAKL